MIKEISFDTYPVVIHVFIDSSNEEITEYIAENSLPLHKDILEFPEETTALFTYSYDSPTVYLRFREIENQAIIAHEAFHVTAFIMRYIGVRFSKNSEEAYAYLLQSIIEKIYE